MKTGKLTHKYCIVNTIIKFLVVINDIIEQYSIYINTKTSKVYHLENILLLEYVVVNKK